MGPGPTRPAGPWMPHPAQRLLLLGTAHLRGTAERARRGHTAAPWGLALPTATRLGRRALPACLWKSREEPQSVGPLKQCRPCSPRLGQT